MLAIRCCARFTSSGAKELEAKFMEEAGAAGMVQLAGHRSVGGLRASLYNALAVADAEKLKTFMADFKARYVVLLERGREQGGGVSRVGGGWGFTATNRGLGGFFCALISHSRRSECAQPPLYPPLSPWFLSLSSRSVAAERWRPRPTDTIACK